MSKNMYVLVGNPYQPLLAQQFEVYTVKTRDVDCELPYYLQHIILKDCAIPDAQIMSVSFDRSTLSHSTIVVDSGCFDNDKHFKKTLDAYHIEFNGLPVFKNKMNFNDEEIKFDYSFEVYNGSAGQTVKSINEFDDAVQLLGDLEQNLDSPDGIKNILGKMLEKVQGKLVKDASKHLVVQQVWAEIKDVKFGDWHGCQYFSFEKNYKNICELVDDGHGEFYDMAFSAMAVFAGFKPDDIQKDFNEYSLNKDTWVAFGVFVRGMTLYLINLLNRDRGNQVYFGQLKSIGMLALRLTGEAVTDKSAQSISKVIDGVIEPYYWNFNYLSEDIVDFEKKQDIFKSCVATWKANDKLDAPIIRLIGGSYYTEMIDLFVHEKKPDNPLVLVSWMMNLAMLTMHFMENEKGTELPSCVGYLSQLFDNFKDNKNDGDFKKEAEFIYNQCKTKNNHTLTIGAIVKFLVGEDKAEMEKLQAFIHSNGKENATYAHSQLWLKKIDALIEAFGDEAYDEDCPLIIFTKARGMVMTPDKDGETINGDDITEKIKNKLFTAESLYKAVKKMDNQMQIGSLVLTFVCNGDEKQCNDLKALIATGSGDVNQFKKLGWADNINKLEKAFGKDASNDKYLIPMFIKFRDAYYQSLK